MSEEFFLVAIMMIVTFFCTILSVWALVETRKLRNEIRRKEWLAKAREEAQKSEQDQFIAGELDALGAMIDRGTAHLRNAQDGLTEDEHRALKPPGIYQMGTGDEERED